MAVDPDERISVEEALARVLERVEPLGSENLALRHALGRVLAEDIVSDIDVSPFAASSMDGYALRRADVEGAAPDANVFIEDISPRSSVTYYVFAQVPKDVLSSYKTCTARIGFTDGYSTKFVTQGGLPNFEYCDDVFNINLTKGAKPSSGSSSSSSASGSSASGYQTLKPGSKGQAVLDARMKLYELGYFKNKPTQKEYTNNMKDYVKKFEKDHGLTQDGILSPEDQVILFSL